MNYEFFDERMVIHLQNTVGVKHVQGSFESPDEY